MAKYRHAKKINIQLIIIIALAVLTIAAVTVGIIITVSNNNKNNEPAPTQVPTMAPTQAPTEAPTEDPEMKYSKLAQNYMKNMSLDDKIYQMLLVSPEALTGVDVVTMAGPSTETALTEKPVGGILYSEQNFESDEQATEMLINIKSFAKYPLFLATNEESENKATYTAESETQAFDDANTIGQKLHTLGLNFNLAPSAAISGDDAYSADPTTAGMLVKQAMLGFRNNNIVTALNAFPSIGENANPYDVMKTSEFVPFVSAFTEGADAVVVGYNKASGIDAEYPAFMSTRIVKDLLITELKFNGLIVSPALKYDALTSEYAKETMVNMSIAAGVNMLVCIDDVDSYVEAIKKGLSDGTITEDMINESVAKILTLKFKYGIIDSNVAPPPTSEIPTDAPTEAVSDPTQEVATTEN